MWSMNARVTRPEDVLVRELDGESVLLNLATESYFGLDDVGTRMWMALTSSASIEAACDTLLLEYEVEPERLRTEIGTFVAKLEEAGLVHVRE
jgi:hypothetical protein